MCEIDFDADEACVKLSERDHVARVRHRCSSCGGWIQPGARYRAMFLASQDGPANEKACAECLPDLDTFGREHHVWVAPSGFDLALEDCIDQEPESRARWEPVLARMRERHRAARLIR